MKLTLARKIFKKREISTFIGQAKIINNYKTNEVFFIINSLSLLQR